VRIIYTFTVLFSLIVSASSAWAVGLGEITVKSKLGQQFNASIPISDASALSAEQLKALNAPAEIYQKLQVDNSYVYQGFNLMIAEEKGTLVLNITTDDPVKEPYLDFVIQLKWPEGILNKEFKVLIDP
jgi:pilus assembly protein FimV